MKIKTTSDGIFATLTPEDVQRAFANHILRTGGIKNADIKSVNIRTIRESDPSVKPHFEVEIIATGVRK